MRRLLDDLRVWTVLLPGALLVGAVGVLDRVLPFPEAEGPWDPLVAPAAPALDGGPLPAATLQALASQGSLAELVDLNPLAGAPLRPTPVAGQPVALPAGLPTLLEEALGPDPFDQALDRARLAVRDPDGLVAKTPGLGADIDARIAAGLRAELAAWAPRLVGGEAVGLLPRVLVAGLGRDAAWHLPAALAPHAEARTYGAWIDLVEASLHDAGAPVVRFDLGLPLDPTQPGRFDLEAWVAAWAAGQPPAADPFVALGRLQAVHLLVRAGLAELVFAGHGRRVGDPLAQADRFGAYRLGALSAGDPCEELGILRERRGALSVRYGLCLPPGAPLVSLSCSNVSDGSSGPQHSSAAVAWFLENGSWPAFLAVEPTAFRLFPRLQGRQLAATSPDGLAAAARDTVQEARSDLVADRAPGALTPIGPGAWRLRIGATGEPDLVVLDATVDHVDADLARRIDLATATLRVARAGPSGTRRLAEHVDPCGEAGDCLETLDALAAVPAPLPTRPERAVAVPLGGHRAEVVLAPDHTNPWVRLAVVRGTDEDRAAFLERAWRLRRGLGERRVLGLHLVEG